MLTMNVNSPLLSEFDADADIPADVGIHAHADSYSADVHASERLPRYVPYVVRGSSEFPGSE